jgi:hypothetical protein
VLTRQDGFLSQRAESRHHVSNTRNEGEMRGG